VIPDEEPVLAREKFFRAAHQLEFFLLEVAVVEDKAASTTDQVMVVVGAIAASVLVSHETIARMDLADKARLVQQLECPIDRGQTDVRIGRLTGAVNVLGAEVLLGSHEQIEYLLAGAGPTLTVIFQGVIVLARARTPGGHFEPTYR
jgi:hypothetical protein